MKTIAGDKPNTPAPLTIHPSSHPIRPESIDRDAVFVMRKLNKAGFASYLVGGGVRDLYLGKSPKDFDISTNARPGQIRKLFPNSSTIGRRFRLVQVFFKGGKIIEVSTLRSLSEHDLDGPEAVLAPNNTYGDLPQDAQRRDLTINSLFFELEECTIIDYVGGITDLDNSTIRFIGDPEKRITRDPVRMIRAIRHCARTGFSIESQSWKSICNNRDTINQCPPSRIRDELFKDFQSGSAANWYLLMVQSELFFSLFPFYGDILTQSINPRQTCHQQLTKAFQLIDSLFRQSTEKGTTLPKSFILALLMLPWAQVQYNIPHIRLKGPGYFQLAKKLRREIDNHLGIQLNLRKSIRQEMVTLLCNLPQFVRFVQNNTTPKWLKKKSYFNRCLLFHDLYMDTISSQEDNLLPSPAAEKVQIPEDTVSRTNSNKKKKAKPAFAPKRKGGVFGFRK